MNKKTNKKIEKLLLGLAVGSVIISFAEGLLFYSAQSYPNVLIRWMLIVKNTIKAFTFSSSIDIKDVAKMLQESTSILEIVINYIYLVMIFIAPYCTLSFIYEVLKKVFRFRKKHQFKKHKGIIIFGYNDEVKMLLKDCSEQNKKKKDNPKQKEWLRQYRIHVVAEKISEDEEVQLLKDNITVHKIDCLKLSKDQLTYFFAQMKSKLVENIILFEESSARNFSLYKMFHEEKEIAELKDDVKFFCRCENESIQILMEDFHDNESEFDMEIISIPGLRVKKTLEENPFHNFYLSKSEIPIEKWELHLLIVGFGKLGQQMLLQAMNQGVVSSSNKILIDVVDFDIEKKFSIFANTFHESYVQIEKNEICIWSDKADGEFRVRFHQMDIRYKQFFQMLEKYGSDKNGGRYTYAAICIEDEEVGIHCLTQIQRYLREHNQETEDTRIVIRMEMDNYMKEYLNRNDMSFRNVAAFAENREVITLEELIHDKLDEDAKEFHRIYSNINIVNAMNTESLSQDESTEELKEEDLQKERAKLWYKLKLFRRDSNRALVQHDKIKEVAWAKLMVNKDSKEELESLFGENGKLLKAHGNVWICEDEERFVENQSNRELYPAVSEMSRMEHRRWCYFMASRGWRNIEPEDRGKDKEILDAEKKNVCLCPWDELIKVKKDTCKYDLMWLLKKIN